MIINSEMTYQQLTNLLDFFGYKKIKKESTFNIYLEENSTSRIFLRNSNSSNLVPVNIYEGILKNMIDFGVAEKKQIEEYLTRDTSPKIPSKQKTSNAWGNEWLTVKGKFTTIGESWDSTQGLAVSQEKLRASIRILNKFRDLALQNKFIFRPSQVNFKIIDFLQGEREVDFLNWKEKLINEIDSPSSTTNPHKLNLFIASPINKTPTPISFEHLYDIFPSYQSWLMAYLDYNGHTLSSNRNDEDLGNTSKIVNLWQTCFNGLAKDVSKSISEDMKEMPVVLFTSSDEDDDSDNQLEIPFK